MEPGDIVDIHEGDMYGVIRERIKGEYRIQGVIRLEHTRFRPSLDGLYSAYEIGRAGFCENDTASQIRIRAAADGYPLDYNCDKCYTPTSTSGSLCAACAREIYPTN